MENQTFSYIQNPDENGCGDYTEEQHSNLFPAGKLADPMKESLLVFEHLGRFSPAYRLDRQVNATTVLLMLLKMLLQ